MLPLGKKPARDPVIAHALAIFSIATRRRQFVGVIVQWFGDEVVRSLEPISGRRRVVAVSAMTAGSWPLDGRGVSMAFDKLDGAFFQNRILSLESFSSSRAYG